MRKVFLLLVVMSVAMISKGQESPTIAVLVYGDTSGVNEFLQNELITAFDDDKTYIVCERQDEFISLINKEHSFQQSGMVDDKYIIELGKKLGAEYVCCIKMLKLLFGEQPIAARIISVEKGGIVRSVQWSGNMNCKDDVKAAAKAICKKMTRSKDL